MNRRSYLSLCALAILTLSLAGCGGGSSNPPPPPPAVSVAFNPQPVSSVVTGATVNLTAVVSNDGANAGVKWAVSCSSSPCGSVSPASTASGATTVYKGPDTVPNPATVTVTATSITDSTKSASAAIKITAPSAPISVALNPQPPASVAATTGATFAAVVNNDSTNAGVTWSVTCGSAQCGSFVPNATPSGSPTTYTAPSAPPTPATVTVTATSVADTTKTASASIAITAAPPLLSDGAYVYHLAGEDGSGPYFVAGTLTVKDGAISGGEQDFMDNNGSFTDSLVASGSNLTTANGNIQMVLNTNNPNLGVNGLETLRGTVVSNARVLIAEFDTFATGNGSLDLQTSTAAPTGGYAFNLTGLDGQTQQQALVIGGVLNLSGTSLSLANSVLDYNDGGTVAQKQSFASGSVTAPDAFGRVVFTLTPSLSSNLPGFVLAGYIVGTNQIQLVENQNDPLNGDLGGVALGQGANTGQFNQAGVAGVSYAFGATGEDTNGIVQIAGGFGLNADGTVGGKLALNDLAFAFGSTITSGTYAVDQTGRVTLNVIATVTPANGPAYDIPFAFQLYLDGNGNALELGVDNSQATAGLAYAQTAPSADFEGSFALAAAGYGGFNNEPAWSAVGPVTVAADSFSGFTDYSVQNANNTASITTSGVSLSGNENSSTGLLTLNGLNAQSFQAPGGYGYYPIDDRRVLAIEVDGQQLGLILLEAVQPN